MVWAHSSGPELACLNWASASYEGVHIWGTAKLQITMMDLVKPEGLKAIFGCVGMLGVAAWGSRLSNHKPNHYEAIFECRPETIAKAGRLGKVHGTGIHLMHSPSSAAIVKPTTSSLLLR